VLVSDGEKMSGSARSIEGIDLFECLSECEDSLLQFGGHTMAAGLSLKAENFMAFRNRFDEVVRRKLNNLQPQPFLEYDAEINFEDITPKFFRILQQFAPFGPENLSPVFLARNIKNTRFTKAVGDGSHVKVHVHQVQHPNISFDGIGFGLGNWAERLKDDVVVDMLFALDENTWNGKTSLQLSIKDIRESNAQPD
jgi:single-stranded-DNA-specific exonuclease